MSSRWSLGIRETCDIKIDGKMQNQESIEGDVYNRISEEREYIEDL